MSLILNKIIFKSRNSHQLIISQVRLLNYVPIETTNKIEVGNKMTKAIEKKRVVYARRQEEKSKYDIKKSRDKLIISSKKPLFNHYYGQHYSKLTENNYASLGWRNNRSTGDYFTINAFGPHPAKIDSDIQKSFNDLNIDEKLIEILESKFNITLPTKIQELSIEKIRSHLYHNLIVAETGCGKTLSYVLPLIEEVLKFKKENNVQRMYNEPICLIIVPTRELALQVYQVLIKFITDDVNFRAVLDQNHQTIMSQEEFINSRIDNSLKTHNAIAPDIVVTTSSRLKEQFYKNSKYISPVYLRKLVIDEANLLLDDSNNKSILKIFNYLDLNLKPLNENGTLTKADNTQLIFVSATIPRDMKNILTDILDVDKELSMINTKNVNKLMLHVPQYFFRLNALKKTEKLLEIVRNSPYNTTMIFSNKTPTAQYVYKLLKDNDIKACLFLSSMDENQRNTSIQKFLSGECNVISCTDIASRGLDTLHVRHVINFEMPTFIADYVHRIGRVGRFGTNTKGCKVTNFVTKAYEVDTVWNIEHSIRSGGDLHNLNANITRILQHTYTPKNNVKIETENNAEEFVKEEEKEEAKN